MVATRFVKDLRGEFKLLCVDMTGISKDYMEKYNSIGGLKHGHTIRKPETRKKV